MSNLWCNLRVAYWHLQIGPDRPRVRISFNRYRWDNANKWPLVQLH